MNLVAVPFHDWKKCETEGFRTRDAHLLQEFQRHARVDRLLVVDRPISIAEMLLRRRPRCVREGRRIYRRGRRCLTQVDAATFVLDVLVGELVRPVLERQRWIPYAYGLPFVGRAVAEAVRHLDMEDYVLFLGSPLPVPLARQLEPRVLVLDAVDDLTRHAGLAWMREELRGYYEQCRTRADVIFANSAETTAWLSEGREPAIHIPNGVDLERFRFDATPPVPEDLASLPRPIVGYAGKMQEMFDVELLGRVAESLPEASFVCIGQQLNARWMKPLWAHPNVHYLGDKHYSALPSYLASFDVCMIPYSQERQHGGDPIKLYEYLAMGKPTVTTDIGGARRFEQLPQLAIVADAAEFASAVRHFSQNGGKLPRVALPPDVQWSSKADAMIRTIGERLARRSAASSSTPSAANSRDA